MKKNILLLFALSFLIGSDSFSQENPIVLGNARFTIITPELVRLEYALDRKFIDAPTLFAVNRNSRCDEFEVTTNDEGWTHISTSRMRIEYFNDGFPFGQTNFRIFYRQGEKEKRFMIYQKNDREKNLGGTIQTLDGKNGRVEVDNGILSHNGWFILKDDYKPILKNGWIENRPKESVMDRYFFAYDKDYKAALKALTAISGKVPLPRKYALGAWYCRWWDYSADEYRQILKEYKAYDFPLDIMVFDMGWHTQKDAKEGTGHAGNRGWTGYSWNKDLIPNPDKLIKEFKDEDVHVALNDHPHDGIRNHESTYQDFMHSLGKTINEPTPLFDAGDPTYMNSFFKYALEPNEDIGIDFWWLDWQQDYLYPYVRGVHGLTHLEWLNHLYFLHSQKNNKRGMNYSRWSGFGSHRYPIQFSGDYEGTWESLEYQVPFTVTSGNSACFFWAHDIGGFFGEPKEKAWELYTRWTQFGLTNTSLRIHSVYDANLDRRPWLWGETAEKSMRIIYHMRSQMMPYIYSTVWQAHKETLPILRGMYLEFPNDDEAYKQEGQYFWGDVFLAAPITEPGIGEYKIVEKSIWLPEGVWYDFFDNTKYKGNKTVTVSSNIYEFPLFAKGGMPIPMQPYTERMSSTKLNELIIRCFPGVDGQTSSFDLYEDDGMSLDYEKDEKALTTLSYTREKNKHSITVHPTQGTYDGQVKKRSYTIELAASKKASFATIDGKKVKSRYDDEKRVNAIDIPPKNIKSQTTIVIHESE